MHESNVAPKGQVAVIAGVGPAVGAALVKKFACMGCDVAMLARTGDVLHRIADECVDLPGHVMSLPCDVTNVSDVAETFELIRRALGPVNLLINHASGSAWIPANESSTEPMENAWRPSVLGAFHCSREAMKDMLPVGRGTIIFTGATSAFQGQAGAVGFSSAKFGLRGLAYSMAAELSPKGIHVAHVVIEGESEGPQPADAPPTLSPETIAEACWTLSQQPESAWTFEMDLRPSGEAIFG